jgi:hypothetical protein
MLRKCQEKNERGVEKWSTIFPRRIECRFVEEEFALAESKSECHLLQAADVVPFTNCG